MIFDHDSKLPEVNGLSYLLLLAAKFLKNNRHYWNSKERVRVLTDKLWAVNKVINLPTTGSLTL